MADRYSYGLVFAVSNDSHSGASTGALKNGSRFTDIVSPLAGLSAGLNSPVSDPSSSLSTVCLSTLLKLPNMSAAGNVQ